MKKFIKILPILLILVLCISNVFAAATLEPTLPTGNGSSITQIDGAAQQIWTTVILVVRILAFAAMIFAGVRYMFASADTKADIKQQTVILLVGAMIVFAAEPIVKFVAGIANTVLANN